MKGWLLIALNEIKLKTNRIRKHRLLIIIFAYSLFLFWSIFLGPELIDRMIPELVKIFAKRYKQIFVLFIEYLLMLTFLLFVMYPIYNLYRKESIKPKEILLSAPVSDGDIFLGEFLGLIPFYFLAVLGVGPIITGLLLQISSLNPIDYIVIYFIVLGLSTFSLLIGSIIANLIEKKMSLNKTASERWKTIILLFSSIIILLIYLIHFSWDFILKNPEYKIWLMFYPSFWYSNIIVYLIAPSEIHFPPIIFLLSCTLAIFIPLLIFYISYKRAELFYLIDKNSEVKRNNSGSSNKILTFLIKMVPDNWKFLVLTEYKIFFRKKESFVKIIYITFIIAIIGLIFYVSIEDIRTLLNINILKHKYLIIMIISWNAAIIFGIFMGIHIFIESKEIITLYKKSPRGISIKVISYLVMMFQIICILDLILVFFFLFLFQLNLFEVIFFIFFFFASCAITFIQAVSIQCLKPLFKEKGKDVLIHIYLLISLQIISFLITFFLILPYFPYKMDICIGISFILLLNLGISSIIALIIFIFAFKYINKII
ncbi:MAG: hypothetical protein ACP6IY_06155 [Promethearchaeia archaeon]